MSRWLPCYLALGLVLSACSDDDKPPTGDLPVAPDQTVQPDVGVDAPLPVPDLPQLPDQTQPDQLVPDQTVVHDANTACNFGLSMAPLTLDAAYCVTHRFQIPTDTAAFNLNGLDLYTFSTSGTLTGEVRQTTISSGQPGTYAKVFDFSVTSANTLYAGQYVAVSPGGFAAVGYTESTTFNGEIFWGDKGIKTPKKVDKATGNWDVVFLDDKSLLINGTGVGLAQSGQGVYIHEEGKAPRKLIKDMGVSSGFMAIGPQVLHAGGMFSGGNKFFAFTLAEVKAAISSGGTLSGTADGDEVYVGNVGDATALGDDLVVTKLDTSWAYQAVTTVPVTVAGNQVQKGTTKDIVNAAGGTVTMLGGSGPRVGMVIKGQPELVIVEKR